MNTYLKIEIELDNDAFLNDERHTVAAILAGYARQLDAHKVNMNASLRDINGNTVGQVWVSQETQRNARRTRQSDQSPQRGSL